jgi:hypothetical protein
MNDSHSITRRNLLKGASTRAASMALIAPVAVAVATPAAASPPAQHATLEELANAFRRDAMKLDPSIKTVWVGSADLGGPAFVLQSLVIERMDTPLVRRSKRLKAQPTAIERAIRTHKRIWQEFDDACTAGFGDIDDPKMTAYVDRIGRRVQRALARLIRLPAMGGRDKATKADYLFRFIDKSGMDLSGDQVMTLLKSLAGFL